jgi:hypothetical protein
MPFFSVSDAQFGKTAPLMDGETLLGSLLPWDGTTLLGSLLPKIELNRNWVFWVGMIVELRRGAQTKIMRTSHSCFEGKDR